MNLDEIGKELHNYRISNNLSLRDLCKKYELDVVTVSKIERGCEIDETTNFVCESIQNIKATKESKGKIECPKCKRNLLFTVSDYNGHIWGKCETDGCLPWMQ